MSNVFEVEGEITAQRKVTVEYSGNDGIIDGTNGTNLKLLTTTSAGAAGPSLILSQSGNKVQVAADTVEFLQTDGVGTNPVITLNGAVTAASLDVGNTFQLTGANPRTSWYENDIAGADEHVWDIIVDAKKMQMRAVNDANTASNIVFEVARGTGTALTSMTINPPIVLGGPRVNGTSGALGALNTMVAHGSTIQRNIAAVDNQTIQAGLAPQATRLVISGGSTSTYQLSNTSAQEGDTFVFSVSLSAAGDTFILKDSGGTTLATHTYTAGSVVNVYVAAAFIGGSWVLTNNVATA